ncbi:unnamed protein product [Heterobilharzia americana]|nr:unnamed protein product [Heterobilharzia americana]
MRKMTGSQENDKYFRDESVTIEWSILESTKMLIALFFNESPTILEKGIRDEATEMNIKIRKNQLPIEKQEQRKQQACDTDGPCLSIISLPRSPVDELDLGEFYLNHDRVFRYLFTQDLKSVSYYEADFLKRHRLTESVRATLCDWMIKVQQYLKLRTESLHLAVNLVDQYTWRRVTLYPSEYQLLGITAIFIAAKLIERFPPSTKTLCYLTENSYSSKQLLDLEFQVLKTLDFTINIPLPHHFLDRAVTACTDLTETGKAKAELICRYLFELSLTELSAVGILATVKCAASVYLARELLHLEYEAKKNKTNDIQSEDSANFILPNEFEIWPEVLGRSLGHESVITLLPMVLIYVKNIKPFLLKSNMPTEIYEAAFQKFSNRGYCRIALSTLLLEADYDAIVKDIKKQMKLNSAFS